MSFYLTLNSRFRPFSYDEMVKPLLQYKEAYDAANQDFSTLAAQTETWRNIATREQNPIAYEMFKGYSDMLNSAIESFRAGMNINNRSTLDLKRGYAKSIVPIQNAYNTRLKHIDEQTKGKAAGMVYASDAAYTPIDEYIKNPSLQHEFADSNAGYKRVASAADALSKKLSRVATGRIDAYTKSFLQEHGYRDNEIQQAIQDIQNALRGDGNIRGTGILQSILADEMHTSGVDTWKDKSRQADYLNRVAPALYRAVGQTDIKPMEDYGARLSAQMAAKNQPSIGRPYRESPNTEATKKNTTKMQDDINFLRQIKNNPNMLQEKVGHFAPGSIPGTSTVVQVQENLNRLEKISKKYGIDFKVDTFTQGNNTYSSDNLDDIINKIEGEIRSSAIRNVSYITDITDSELIFKNIAENATTKYQDRKDTGLRSYEQGEIDNDPISAKELMEYSKNAYLQYKPKVGFVLTGYNDSGEPKSFWVDPETLSGRLSNDMSTNFYQGKMNDLDLALEIGDTDLSSKIIDNIMRNVYAEFNTLATKQSKSSSK